MNFRQWLNTEDITEKVQKPNWDDTEQTLKNAEELDEDVAKMPASSIKTLIELNKTLDPGDTVIDIKGKPIKGMKLIEVNSSSMTTASKDRIEQLNYIDGERTTIYIDTQKLKKYL